MIVSEKIRFWTTSPGPSMNKLVEDLLTPTPSSVCISGYSLRMKCICVHLNQEFLLLQVLTVIINPPLVLYMYICFYTCSSFHLKPFCGVGGSSRIEVCGGSLNAVTRVIQT